MKGIIYTNNIPKSGSENRPPTQWLDGNNLKVRGYLAMFYETQTWTRK
jgi:hypothetical protein